MAWTPFSGARPACEARPWTISFASPTPLREVLMRPRGTERGFEDKDGIATAGFGFDEFTRGFAADFFIRSPEKNDAFGKRNSGFRQSVEGKESLHNAALHVEDAGAVSLACFYVKRHFGQGAGRIDSVVMAEHQKLGFGPRRSGRPNDAEMIAAMLLRDDADECFAMEPEIREETAAAVGGEFFRCWEIRGKPVDGACRASAEGVGAKVAGKFQGELSASAWRDDVNNRNGSPPNIPMVPQEPRGCSWLLDARRRGGWFGRAECNKMRAGKKEECFVGGWDCL